MSAGQVLAALAVGATAAASYSQIQGAKAQKKMYNRQADVAERKAKLDALQYKQQSVDVLKKLNRVLAANTARAAAGNLNPFSTNDSTDIVLTYNLRQAVNDFTIARDNRTIAEKMGKFQANNLRYAGKMAVKTAKTQAIFNIAQSIAVAGATLGTQGGGTQTTTQAPVVQGNTLNTIIPSTPYAPPATTVPVPSTV